MTMTSGKTVAQMTEIVLDEQARLTLAEVSRACAVHAEYIVELVEEGALAPIGADPHRWRFTGAHMRRARVAVHLQADLGINLPGAALALQLLDEIEDLRARLRAVSGD
jgi:chaperone modulatory protein CbpM